MTTARKPRNHRMHKPLRVCRAAAGVGPDNTVNNNSVSNNKSTAYQYGSETRLIQAATSAGALFGNDTETFTLDAVGNRIAHSRVAGAWVYDANNRLTKLGNGTCGQGAACFTYDAQGNQTQRTGNTGNTTQYRYDSQNRLVAVSTLINGISQPVAQYGYDPLDRRLWKEQYRDKSGNPLAQARRSYYLYADEGLIAEASQDISLNADGSVTAAATGNTTPVITTQYGPRPDSEFTTGMLFIKTRNTNAQNTVAYYHHDHLDTPIQATDKAGNIVWAASYSAFGQASIITPQATVDRPTITSNLRLPGQYEDIETGLHYNYRRYYDPATGRYVTSDPIGLEGGINRYTYANGSPLKYIDPMGMTQADINAAVNAAKLMQPNWQFPLEVKTWSQEGKGGKNSFLDKNIYVDSKYLGCLDDGEAGALLSTVLHELAHFNQKWYEFAIDNIRERVTLGNSSNAQDIADSLLWKNDKILADYLKNRHVDKNSCQCRR